MQQQVGRIENNIWQTRIDKHEKRSQLATMRYEATGHNYFKIEAEFQKKVALLARSCVR